MSENGKSVASVNFATDAPTELNFLDLENWVIWQYPRPKVSAWLCGAVHPPIAEYGWIPAMINPIHERLRIHAHRSGPFETPEAAAEWLEKSEP